MGLTTSQGKTVTKAIATRYKRADKAGKGVILVELCATTVGTAVTPVRRWRRRCGPRIVRPRRAREPRYGGDVITGLTFCWAVLGAPNGKRLAPIIGELVPRLQRFEPLMISDETAAALVAMAPAHDGPPAGRRGPKCSYELAATPSPVRS